jgi:hypothetical protein
MKTKRLWAIFFLILMINGVFASTIDPNRVFSTEDTSYYFDDAIPINYTDEPINYTQDKVISECYTEELSPEAVENIWNEILVNGFKADLITSDQPANLNRETLKANEVIITDKDTKSGDVVGKTEIPNKIMDPLEVPTVLGQVCYGPFSSGLDLDSTLRVGRCAGGDQAACYLEGEGLFRQNGSYGFVDQTLSVSKDFLDMLGLKKLEEVSNELIDPELDYDTNVDLGLFSDMSYEELAEFRKSQFQDSNLTEIDIKKMELVLDKAIENSMFTDSFNASMESTCNSDNCYINMYSLFDKVFNQYYSADMVFTSASPVLWKFTGKIFRNVPNKLGAQKLIASDKIGGIRGKNGFLDNFLNKDMSAVSSAVQTYKYSKITKNIDDYAAKLAKSNDNIINNIIRYNMKPEFDKYVNALNSKKNADTIKNEFFKDGTFAKMNKPQQRVFMESVLEYQNNIRTVRMVQDFTTDNLKKTLKEPLENLFNKSKTMEDFYQSLTKEEYDLLLEETKRLNGLNKSFSTFTENKFKWDDGADNITLLKERGKIINDEEVLLNKVRLKNEVTSTELTGSSKFGDIISENKISPFQTKKITVNFKDGPSEVEVIIPFKEKISDSSTMLNYNDIIYNKKPDVLIEYVAKDGTAKKVRGSVIDIGDVDPGKQINMRDIKDTAVPDAELSKYGINPLEVSYGYLQELGIKKIKDAEIVTDGVVNVLKDQGWSTGRGLSYINQRMKQQTVTQWDKRGFNIMSDSAKAYLYNFGYWQFKTAGSTIFGGAFDRYSMFRIPETYTSIIFKHGESGDIYNDSYIDFFANDGSDQGDLFMDYFNSIIFWMVNLPKGALENTEWETTQGFSNWITELTEGHIRRSSTDNIAILTDAMNNNCSTTSCHIKVGDSSLLEEVTRSKSMDANNTYTPSLKKNIEVNYATGNAIKTTSYILENTSEENFEEEGQTLIAFSHHTDYDGSLAGFNSTDSVNLLQSINEEETCSDKLKNLEVMGIPIGWTNQITGKSYRAGAVAAGFSNIVYYSLSVPQHRVVLGAIFGDILPQVVIVPEIYNCVDHEEGYYSHFFVASEEYERIEKDPKNKVGDAISKGADSVEKSLTNITKNTELQESISKTTQEVKQFAETEIKDNPIMQSRIETQGNTSGSMNAKLFFLEIGESSMCRASGYNDKGVEHLVDSKTGETLVVDKEEGVVEIVDKDGNVKEIISSKNKDWVRLMATNLGIPAKVIPHSLSYIPVPDTNTPLFNIDVYGNLKIDDAEFLSCLKRNYYEQTGLEMSGNTLTEYLGSVKQVITTNNLNPDSQYDIIPKGMNSSAEIIAEGTPRRIASGESARINVLGNRTTKLYPIEGKEVTLGKNISVQFERGQLIYNGEKNSYIMWVEQTYVMHQSEIKGMDVDPIKETNPETGCEEDAFEISVSPDTSNPEAVKKSENMNKALEKVGPFKMFDTPTKTFIFYTTEPPECQNRMKIIDKETGQVIDQAIDEIITTPDGFIVRTEDGQEHNFEFSAEDGVPKLKYNDQTETLLSAQGKNGSFWYDPKTGNWYTENGHLIPFDPEYRDGMTFKVGEDGKAYGTTVNNLLGNPAATGGSDRGTLNLPLTPEKILPFTLYILVIMASFMYLFSSRTQKFKKR